MPESKTIRSIAGSQTTAGASEETVNLSVDGAVAAATISVVSNTCLIVSDAMFTAEGAGRFKIQQTNDGSTWFDILYFRMPADGSGGLSEMKIPLYVKGGTSVAIRVRAQTPGGAALVSATLRAYTES